ncbi:unnamed protein product, partial [Mesorhabditis belari]|uniref:7TM GPCR serpentine receptor class x (Srx) domain-containing protein n=1 Tax=Mesorhabditis belari TaxID=2138241 RepID=A0AAF3EPV0_9BILA
MLLLGTLGVTAGVTGIVVVSRNSFLRGIVRHYLLIDLSNYILVNAGHLLWAVPCAIWRLNYQLPVVDYLFGDLVNTAVCMGYFPKLFLGMNRFFAIAFDGVYHHKYERTAVIQYLLMMLCPLASFIAFGLPGCHAIFLPDGQNFYFAEGGCGEATIYYTQVLPPAIFLPLDACFDGFSFIMLYRRVQQLQKGRQQMSSQKADQLRKGYKLALQMVSNFIAGASSATGVAIGQNYVTSPMGSFLLWTALWQGCCTVQCTTYVFLLSERRTKPRATLPVQKATVQTSQVD